MRREAAALREAPNHEALPSGRGAQRRSLGCSQSCSCTSTAAAERGSQPPALASST